MFSSRGFGEESVETEQKKVIDQDWIHIDRETPVIALPDRVITGHLTVRVDPMLEAVQFPVGHVVNQFCVSTTNFQLRVILRCWGKSSLVEGRFSKWF